MKIAIIGAGDVGGTLGQNLAHKGYEIIFGVREPQGEKMRSLLASIPGNATADTVPVVAAAADVVILATPWSATQAAIKNCSDLTNKIVIDCTNPLTEDFSDLSMGFTTSGGEQVAEWAKGAKVFKAFNQTGWKNMENPVYDGKASVMFVCGDDEEAKKTVMEIVSDVGFEAIDAGNLKISRLPKSANHAQLQTCLTFG